MTEPRGDVCRVSARHRSSEESYRLDLVGLVSCRTYRQLDRDGSGSNRAEAVFNGNTIFPGEHFRSPRRTVLAFVSAISAQRVHGHDQIRDRGAILAHSRSAHRHGRYRWRDGYILSEPAGIETRSSSLRSASNLHQRDQRSGHHTHDRKIDGTALREAVTRLSPG